MAAGSRAGLSRAIQRRRGAARRAVRVLDPGCSSRFAGEMGPAHGLARPGRAGCWSARKAECVEQRLHADAGRLPARGREGDCDGASATAASAAEIGERFGDRDLFASRSPPSGRATSSSGHGRVRGEASACWTRRWLTPRPGALADRHRNRLLRGDPWPASRSTTLRRADEWTAPQRVGGSSSPTSWRSPAAASSIDAQLMQLQGAWPEALEETDTRRPPLSRRQ